MIEFVFFCVAVLNFCLEIYEFVLEGTEGVFELSYFLTFFAFLGCSLGYAVVVVVYILLLDTVEFDDHLFFAVIFDEHAFVFEHLF